MIEQLPFFKGVPTAMTNKIEQEAEHKKLDSGTFVFTEGEMGDELYVILSGEVDVYHKIAEKNVLVSTLKVGDFFGEIALVTHSPRTATVVTKTPCEFYLVSRELFEKIFGTDPELSTRISQAIVGRMEDNERRAYFADNQ